MTVRIPHLALVPLMVGLLMLGSCGGDEGTDSSSASRSASSSTASTEAPAGTGTDAIDVCSMVPDATVEKALSEAATATPEAADPLFSCRWDGEGSDVNQLTVSVMVSSDADAARALFESSNAEPESEIMGLGDAAVYSETFGLEVLTGRYSVSVDNSGPTEKQSDLEIAKVVMAALPD